MSSYFIKRGAPAERGCIDEKALHRMVAEEHLAPDDLVWIDGLTPGWVRATAVPGLFPESEPEPAPEPRDVPELELVQQSVPPAVEEQQPRRKRKPFRRPFGGKWVPVLILALIGAVGAFLLPRFYAGRMDEPRAEAPPQPAAPTNNMPETYATRDWSLELAELSRLLDKSELGTARAMLQTIQAEGCSAPELVPLAERLRLLEADRAYAQEQEDARLRALEADRAYAQKQEDALSRGQLELAAVDSFVATVRRLQLMPALRNQIGHMLVEPGVDAAQVSQSIAVGLAMGDSNVVTDAVAWVVKAPTKQLVTAPFWPVLGQLSERGQPRVAEALCRALLRADARDPRLGIELAALLCSQGRNDDAIDALKKARKYASEEAKKRAVADPRFTPIRGDRHFARYLK